MNNNDMKMKKKKKKSILLKEFFFENTSTIQCHISSLKRLTIISSIIISLSFIASICAIEFNNFMILKPFFTFNSIERIEKERLKMKGFIFYCDIMWMVHKLWGHFSRHNFIALLELWGPFYVVILSTFYILWKIKRIPNGSLWKKGFNYYTLCTFNTAINDKKDKRKDVRRISKGTL